MTDKPFVLHTGDCRDVMRTMESDSIDSIVTDPPYGLSFMGKGWDHGVPGVEFWVEALRVAKPGAHLLAFGGTRTFHRLAVAIEDAGWEIRDCVMWVYGSGFPKSLDVSKAIDKAAGAERERVGTHKGSGYTKANVQQGAQGRETWEWEKLSDEPASREAQRWQGWGTALKPAWEPVIVARKPLCGTVAENVLRHGTGAINIDGCRVGTESTGWNGLTADRSGTAWDASGLKKADGIQRQSTGRWPSNLIHDGSDEVVGLFPESGNGNGKPTIAKRKRNKGWGNSSPGEGVDAIDNYGDFSSAARFFYCAKASKADRDEGCENIEERMTGMSNGAQMHGEGYDKGQDIGLNRVIPRRNHHPTVKPTALMRYLCRLVTQPNGVILDPFMGSGSTGKAAMLEGFRFVGIDITPEYASIAEARIEHALEGEP